MLRTSLITASFLAVSSAVHAGDILKVPDRFPEIQQAIDAALPGQRIVVSKGEYRENLTIHSRLDGLVLEADGRVTLDAGLAETAIRIMADDVTVDGFTIRHGKEFGIRSFDLAGPVLRTTLRDLKIQRCGGSGIELNGAGHRVVSCELEAVGYGVRLLGDDGVLSAIEIRGAGDQGIHVRGRNVVVRKCRLSNIEDYGINVRGDQVRISDNDIRNTYYEAVYVSGDGALVRNNRIQHSYEDGIVAHGDHSVIRHNRIEKTGEYGISTSGANPTIVDNHLKAVGAYGSEGISVSNAASAGLVEGNRVSICPTLGIEIRADGVTVVDNVVELTGTGRDQQGAIEITGNNNVVVGNRARQNHCDGFQVSGDGNRLEDNEAIDNHEDGIQVVSGTGNIVESNLVKGNLGEGIEVNAILTQVRNNRLKKNRIDLANNGSASTFSGNKFKTGGAGQAPEIDH